MVLARAVRKAVSSSAFTIPSGFPVRSSSVTDPFGEVLCELAIDAGGRNEEPSIESRPDDSVDEGDSVIEPKSFVADLMEALELGVPARVSDLLDAIDDFLLVGASGCSSDTIFMPTDVPVDAGMKRVVTPLFLITVR